MGVITVEPPYYAQYGSTLPGVAMYMYKVSRIYQAQSVEAKY